MNEQIQMIHPRTGKIGWVSKKYEALAKEKGFKEASGSNLEVDTPMEVVTSEIDLTPLQETIEVSETPAGDSWGALVGKSALKGATSIADLPRLAADIAEGSVNFVGKKLADREPTDYSSYIPSTEDIRDNINKYTGIDLTPRPNTAAKRIVSNAIDFGSGVLPWNAMFHVTKKAKEGMKLFDKLNVKDQAKLAGMGAAIGGTSGAAQEVGVDPLVADIASSVIVPNANNIKRNLQKGALNAVGLSPDKINIPALEAAKKYDISIPTAAATDSRLLDLTDQVVGKAPWFGDKLRKKYNKVDEAIIEELEKIYNKVGPADTKETRKLINKLYSETKELLPEDAAVPSQEILQKLKSVKDKVVTPIPNEGEKKVLNTTKKLSQEFDKPKKSIPVKLLIGAKKSLNDDLDWNKHMGVRELLKGTHNTISDGIAQYGTTNPEWFKSFKKADKIFGDKERRKDLEQLLTNKATNVATDAFSNNSIAKSIFQKDKQEILERTVGTDIFNQLKELGHISKAISKKSARIPNPSGTAPTAAVLGTIIGLFTAPLSTLGVVAGTAGASKLLTDQKILDLALKFAKEYSEKGKVNLLTTQALSKSLKDLTGKTPLTLSRELQRKSKDNKDDE